jgi:mannose-6-phosphate isomerase-like protein (cupin superfamily)
MDSPLRFSEFEAAERARGCQEVVARSWGADVVQDTHAHPFHARAVVVEGEMWLTVDGVTEHLGVGDRFDIPAGKPHAERYGPRGATYWVGRY